MSSETPLVSIVVPIYNAELYLFDCLSSIEAQTHKNIEVILINDGSNDSSCSIAKLFCEKDTRFQLITQINAGVAAAREKGLRVARGEFIIHADADDLTAERGIEYLYKSIVNNSSDIAVGAYTKQSDEGNEFIRHYADDKYTFTRNILTGQYHSSLCNKLIKIDLCRNITFDEGINYMEDKLFLAKILKKNDIKISITNKNVYFYRKVATSYTNKISYNSILSSIKVTDRICTMFQDMYSDKFIAHVKNNNKVMVLLNSKTSQRNRSPELTKYLLNDRDIPLKHKVIIVFDLLHMGHSIKLYKFLHLKASKKSV